MANARHVLTDVLEIAFEASGDPRGQAVVLLHGFPYDVRAFDDVVPILVERGAYVVVPYLRGFGPTRFRSLDTMRSGQQAALAQDLRDLLDALAIDSAIVAGYDWGGRAACIAAALWPERVRGLVSVDGYNIQSIAHAMEPSWPAAEASYWYQYYFHSERGRRGLERNREELCELLWHMWSPTWNFDHETFARSATSLHNPDFVDVVIHSYRHRFGLVSGDERYEHIEEVLATSPPIAVPTVVLESGSDGVLGPSAAEDRDQFTGPYQHLLLPNVGHNVPQEAPAAFAGAVVTLLEMDAGADT
jgi:pimeloyl-ACP methyl ester carboxylesterase